MATEMLPDASNLPDWDDPAWGNMSENEFYDALAVKMEGEPAILDMQGMDRIESMWKEDMRNRRCILAALLKPFSEIREGIEKDDGFAEAMAACYVRANNTAEMLETIAGLVRNAESRMMVALAHRPDMGEIVERAKAEAAA